MDSELKLRKVRACKKENSGPEGRPDRHQHINTESTEQEPYSRISKGTQIAASISPDNHSYLF